MHIADLTAPEQRVLGCLIEKRFTTPDQYPLTLNALRLACNQSTNRDPVVDYDERTVREAADRLTQYGVARMVSGHSSRAIKYRHLAEECARRSTPSSSRSCASCCCAAGRRRASSSSEPSGCSAFSSVEAVDEVLATLIEQGYVAPRRHGSRARRRTASSSCSEDAAAPARRRRRRRGN